MGGVILESLKIGGTTYTSIEAMQRFAAKMSGGIKTIPSARKGADSHSMITQALQIELGIDSQSQPRNQF
tara:strand:- start:73 stop:282 length:210 start_codon:yes stop_codon:yes gene_type:complete